MVKENSKELVTTVGSKKYKSYFFMELSSEVAEQLKEKQVKTIKSNNKKGKQATIGESDVKDQTGSDSLFNIPLDEQPKNQSNFYLSF
jgi:hypothetical protein